MDMLEGVKVLSKECVYRTVHEVVTNVELMCNNAQKPVETSICRPRILQLIDSTDMDELIGLTDLRVSSLHGIVGLVNFTRRRARQVACGPQVAQYEKLKRENTRLGGEVERLEKEVLRQKSLRCGV